MYLKPGMRVMANAVTLKVGYIKSRARYTNMYTGKTGTVIGMSGTGKVAVEFDDVVFVGELRSSHDNGCHGQGKDHHCWYIPTYALDLIPEQDNLLLLC